MKIVEGTAELPLYLHETFSYTTCIMKTIIEFPKFKFICISLWMFRACRLKEVILNANRANFNSKVKHARSF